MGPIADRTIKAVITGSSAGAVKAFQETALAADTAAGTVGDKFQSAGGKVAGAFSKLGNAASGIPLLGSSLSALGDKFDNLSSKGQKFTASVSELGKVSLLGGAGALVAFGGEAVKLGTSFQDSTRQMDTSITASGESLKRWQPAIDAAQQKFEALGFTNSEVDDALGHSVISTQNMGKSLDIMGVAADLARAKHTSLSSAVDSVDKALTGNIRPLMQMGISLPVVASSAQKLALANTAVTTAQANVNAILAKVPDAANPGSAAYGIYESAVNKLTGAHQKLSAQQATSGQILDALTQRLKGQAADAADTFAGKMNVLKAQASDLGAQIGEALIPKIEDVVGWLTKNKGAAEDLAKAIGLVLGGAVVVFVGEKVASFVNGIKSMIGAVGNLASKFTTTRASIIADQALIEGGNTGLVSSFRASALAAVTALGPLLGALAAVAVGYKLVQDIRDNSGKINVKGTGNLATAVSEENNTAVATLFGKNSDQVKKAAAAEVAAYNNNLNQSSAKGGDLGGGAAAAGQEKAAAEAAAKAETALAAARAAAAAAAARNKTATDAYNASAAAAEAKTASAASALQSKLAAAAKTASDALTKFKGTVTDLVTNALSKAEDKLKTAASAFTTFQQSVASSVSGALDFGTADANSLASGGTSTFLTQLAGQAGTVTDFTSKVQTLLADGLSKGALQQVLAAGTSAGDDIATQLLAGGASAITQANDLTQAVSNMANSLGVDAADNFYQSGVSQARSIVDGIKDEAKRLKPQLQAASLTIAENLKTQVEVDLKIISGGGKIPGFAAGGTVPGPIGSPLLAIVHGGEVVTPVGGGGSPSGGDYYDFSGMTVVANDPQTLVNQLRQYIRTRGSLASAGVA